MEFISWPFGWIMHYIYIFVGNYGVALILFTFLTRLILFPLSIKQQKNTARMQILNPKLNIARKKYANNKTKLNEETMKIYAEENVSPTSGCLPLLIQMPIIYGLYYVIVRPLTHIIRLSSDVINQAAQVMYDNQGSIDAIKHISSKTLESRPEVYLIQSYNSNPSLFSGIDGIDKLGSLDYSFLGLDFGGIPSFTDILILIPIISFIVNLALTLYQQYRMKQTNGNMPGMAGMNMMMYVMPFVSAAFTFTVPAGVGFYWILSSLFAFLQTVVLYKIYTPERVQASLAKHPPKKARKSFMQRALEAQQSQDVTYRPERVNDTSDEKLSKSALKDFQRQRLAQARKRMAEKYGDEYDDSADK